MSKYIPKFWDKKNNLISLILTPLSLIYLIIILINKLKINFLVIGNINKKPKISVAKPGMISRSAAIAIAAPEITS